MIHTRRKVVAAAAALALLATACGDGGGDGNDDGATATDDGVTDDDGAAEDDGGDDGDDGTAAEGDCEELEQTSVQLKWVAQAQFAGFFAADDQGFYADECLEVEILEGGPDVGPAQVVAGGGADFGIDWVASTLSQRAAGEDFITIAQIYQRSGLMQVAWADSGIESFEDLEGTTVGAWGFGNEYELLAALQQAGLDPNSDVDLVDQPFDMTLLLDRDIDSAQAITYNEYAQLLETENPETGELYQPEDFVTLDMNEAGVAMLHDSIFASQEFVEANEDLVVRFLRASFRGWMHCRDNPEDCVTSTFDRGSILGQGHQRWMMNEVNALIWPSENGIGFLDPEAFDRTAEIATTYVDGIEEQPGDDAYTNDYVEQAWEGLEGDTTGDGWEKEEVEVTPGGE
ncbi:MAG: ABC transporter substrate-binding protein [Nitriliruptor sp.]|uniref:ABC transporter substrate-binding protein n=1 Tax=Nitriliruptor sp. TaxID=2448056 RepID=UPI0034A0A8B9